jgi:integrase
VTDELIAKSPLHRDGRCTVKGAGSTAAAERPVASVAEITAARTLHDLRHSGLTWSGGTGAPLAELMRRGGHSDPKASIRYQHATRELGRAWRTTWTISRDTYRGLPKTR